MRHCLLYILVSLPLVVSAQESNDSTTLWASPSVKGMNLGKGIVIGYQRMAPYNIRSESQVPQVEDAPSREIDRVSNRILKLRLPVLRKEQTQAVIGFEYNVDQFEFEDPAALEYEFYDKLHNRNLPSRGLKLYLNHSLSERKFIFTRASIELNGDIPDKLTPGSFKYSLSGSLGWKESETKAWGVGFYFTYSFGRPLLLPGLLYNKTWNDKWGIEAVFPGTVQLRFSPNENNFIYLGYDVFGASYNIDLGETLNQSFDNIQVRRSEILPTIRLEKEIYDFIWLSLEAGYRYNLNFKISEDKFFNEKVIMINEVDPGAFLGASLFVIPTESLKKFFTKKK